jgi:hypothetical protein
VELRGGGVRGVAERMLERAHEIGLALDAHDPPRNISFKYGSGLARDRRRRKWR